jgi:hypothetical protein
MLGSLGMHENHLAHRFAYMKTDIPVAGSATISSVGSAEEETR